MKVRSAFLCLVLLTLVGCFGSSGGKQSQADTSLGQGGVGQPQPDGANRHDDALELLGQVYGLEQSFHGDYNRFTSDLADSGFTGSEKPHLYKVGFISPFNDSPFQGANPNAKDSDHISSFKYDNQFGILGLSFDEAKKYCSDCIATAKTFKVVAIGKIPGLDVWTIDQDKTVIHIRDGASGQ